jgi:chorismate mutase / prephenate dehydrogenase
MELAAEIGRIKARAGTEVVVRDVEDRVLTRARRHAEACGVSEDVMEEIFSAIVRGSVERQHRVGVELRAVRGDRVLVVGGAGGMGSWFRRFLGLIGHRVDALDPAWRSLSPAPGRFRALSEIDDLDRYAAILVAAPLAATPAVLDDLIERRAQGLLIEIASIKSHLAGAHAAARQAGLSVSALHPMFGPAKSPYEPLTFVLACQDAPDDERARLEPLLRHPYTRLVTVPFAHHDRLMGWLLGLAHLTGMLFGTALGRSGLDAAELEACASTTFQRQAATAQSVLVEDSDLYLDIQRLNPHRDEVYSAAREALDELVALVEAGDREGFRSTLAFARRTIGGEA